MHDELVELVKELRNMFRGYKATDNENCRHAKTILQAADAIEELTRENDSLAKSVNEASEILRRRWIPVTEALPESGGSYIVYLRPFKGKYVIGDLSYDLSYPTEMYFNKGQMLWVCENESYNAILSVVDTENEYHVTHWMPLPQPPKED